MAITIPPMSRTNFFNPEPLTEQDKLRIGLSLANRFTHLSLEMEQAEKALREHFLPLVKATLAEKGEEAAREVARLIPTESITYIFALDQISSWNKRTPS